MIGLMISMKIRLLIGSITLLMLYLLNYRLLCLIGTVLIFIFVIM